MTFGKQFSESYGLLDQASCPASISSTLQKCIQWFSEPKLRVRGGARSVVLATKMTWIRDVPKCLNAKNITEAIDGSGSALTIVLTVSKSTMIMVQAASLGLAVTVEVAFLTPPPLSDLRSQALLPREEGHCPKIWLGWLFT
ncbi:hypothetical protein L3X38_019752 [Prunus dulcis]|uniref:Uncharacterized protein n=1 Tax=Prunus dulcis TaxID=3755 RepID=A0AAD4ZCV6_PRUDU|nr:hypothetical protein L3X38_019752 [Prunus dulcis]